MFDRLQKISVLMVLLILGCEEDSTPDYAADLVGLYVVSSMQIDGIDYDLSVLPSEMGQFVEITREEIIFYSNEETICSEDYDVDSTALTRFTAGSLVMDDNTFLAYSFSGNTLILSDATDEISLTPFAGSFPPASWMDLELLSNDTYEPNNTNLVATRIASGGTDQNHYMGACGDYDFFVFSATEDASYVIESTTPDSPFLDLYLTLYSANGDYIDASDDQDNSNLNPRLVFSVENTGDYYFVLESYYFEDSGFYTVSVSPLGQTASSNDLGQIKPQEGRIKRALLPSARAWVADRFFQGE